MHFPKFLEKQIKLIHLTLKRCKAFYFWKKKLIYVPTIYIIELILKSRVEFSSATIIKILDAKEILFFMLNAKM